MIRQKILIGLTLFSIVGCENMNFNSANSTLQISENVDSSLISSTNNQENEPSYLKGRIPQPGNYLYDDFSKGIDQDKWFISVGNWSSQVSNGLKASNVGYTKEGILVLKANGSYYGDSTMQRTGAALVSKETLGPGKYEIAMKVMPRLGACTAFWTFYYENDNYNHEIDIELPAKKSYEYILNTNWIGVGSKEHTSKTIETLTPANDGKWHKYTFEWHTSPSVIKYYVDDILTATTTTHVPTANGQLWVGVWFPVNWAGIPNFESDYVLVDWIGYQKYDEPSIKTNPSSRNMASRADYPISPITIDDRNYISNSNFINKNDAWKFSNQHSFISNDEADRGLFVFNNSNAYQLIEAVYSNYQFKINFDFLIEKGEGGLLKVECLDANEEVINEGVIIFDLTESKFYDYLFTTCIGTKNLKISFHSINSSIISVKKIKLNLI